jgi:predicted aspartyl protease
MIQDNYHYAFDDEYLGIPKELITDVMLYPAPTSHNTKGIKIKALWDTGATHSCLSQKIAEDLGLKPIDTTIVHGVNHSQAANIVLASIELTNGLLFQDRRFSVSKIPGADALIGMDIIMKGDFAISNSGGKTRFSFVIPPFKEKISFKEKADEINKQLWKIKPN